jgi:hypothetical protein
MIESAQYVEDADGDVIGINVIYDGITTTVPLTGGMWLHAELEKWVAAGGVIQPAAPVKAVK